MIVSFTLPSGAKLEVDEAPFRVAESLNDAIMDEGKKLVISGTDEVDYNFIKNVALTGFSSKPIKLALNECMKRALYNGLKITEDTWEPTEARGDYYLACFHVAEVNVRPFMKNLFAQFGVIVSKIKATTQA